jgi:hypothetical protein
MDFKRIFRGPIVYIVLAVVLVWVGSSLLTGTGFREVSTQKGLDLLQGDTVSSAKIVDGEQRVDLTLSKADGDNGSQVQFYYVAPRGTEVVEAITASDADFNDEVPQTSFLSSLIGILLPFLIIGVIFYFLFMRMQGGGNKVMQFGKSKARLVMSLEPTRPSRNSKRSKTSSRIPPASRPSEPASRRVCCSTALPEPVRPSLPAPSPARPECRSTRFPVLTSSRCLWVSVRAASATCSPRPRKTPRPSSL